MGDCLTLISCQHLKKRKDSISCWSQDLQEPSPPAVAKGVSEQPCHLTTPSTPIYTLIKPSPFGDNVTILVLCRCWVIMSLHQGQRGTAEQHAWLMSDSPWGTFRWPV